MIHKKPWYPGTSNELREHFRNKRESRKLAHECPIPGCVHGMVKDLKSGKIRQCCGCLGTGKLKPKK